MYAMETSCCFSGYRPDKLPWGWQEDDPRCDALKLRLRQAIEEAHAAGYRHFICGMAAGVDLYCCEILQALRQTRSLTVEAAIPCPSQANQWPQAVRDKYRALLALCDRQTLISPHYTPSCMQLRNRYMVDNANRLIAVFDGQTGGTRSTVQYAMSLRRELVLLPPQE